MLVAVWSVKGGVGVTSIAAMLALGQAERAEETLLVDLDGDMPAMLGFDDHDGSLGLVDWCATHHRTPDALARLEVDVRPSLRFLPRGRGDLVGDPTPLITTLVSSRRHVIVDCGTIRTGEEYAAEIVQSAAMSLLVVRECFLNLRAVQQSTIVPSGVVVIKERGRHLGRADVELVAGAPVVAEFAFDSSVAQSIDAGLVQARLPRPLVRAIARVLSNGRQANRTIAT